MWRQSIEGVVTRALSFGALLGNSSLDELALIYAVADLFLFFSKSQTFDLMMPEAMACGTPVAAYPLNGPQ